MYHPSQVMPPDTRIMKDAFDVLFTFLAHCEGDVFARGDSPVPPEVKQLLARFAAGECSQAERGEVCELLKAQPMLLAMLADEVKSIRKPNTKGTAR